MKDKILVALDVATSAEAKEIIAELKDFVGGFKIGLQLFTACGASLVKEVAKDNKLFLDLKFHDIPNTVAKASVEIARLGVFMFNVHAIGGSEMMKQTVNQVREVCDKENLKQPKIIGVTVLTSSNEETLNEVGIFLQTEKQVLNLAKLTAKCGLDGVVSSAKEINLIRQNIIDKDFLIVTPGIRPSFATSDDQKRVMTPNEAVQAGSNYLVIGRPIIKAENRINAVEKILSEINS
ncbi:MAG: orotidine-5'-phosphate decarboxylase [Pyrinomonadaceae bacterium]|jgi:orotidine-5'-phosphate decarboxylase|nr:orotidine-5'-phosphate decarboxylase [Pyrinomonadaceae bacterium]